MALQGTLQVMLQVALHLANLDCWSAEKAKCTWSIEAPLEALRQSEAASLFLHLLYYITLEFVILYLNCKNISHNEVGWSKLKPLHPHFILLKPQLKRDLKRTLKCHSWLSLLHFSSNRFSIHGWEFTSCALRNPSKLRSSIAADK